jgi:hypothetical protein
MSFKWCPFTENESPRFGALIAEPGVGGTALVLCIIGWSNGSGSPMFSDFGVVGEFGGFDVSVSKSLNSSSESEEFGVEIEKSELGVIWFSGLMIDVEVDVVFNLFFLILADFSGLDKGLVSGCLDDLVCIN